MAKKQSKVISFRLPFKEYAKLLIECEECEKDPSEYIREKLLSNEDIEPTKKELEGSIKIIEELEERNKYSEEQREITGKKLAEAEQHVLGVTEDYGVQIKKIKELKKQAATTESKTKKTLLAKEKKIKGLEDELKKFSTKIASQGNEAKELKKKISDAESKSKKALVEKEKEIKKLNERILSANEYLIEEKIGIGIMGGGETPQF